MYDPAPFPLAQQRYILFMLFFPASKVLVTFNYVFSSFSNFDYVTVCHSDWFFCAFSILSFDHFSCWIVGFISAYICTHACVLALSVCPCMQTHPHTHPYLSLLRNPSWPPDSNLLSWVFLQYFLFLTFKYLFLKISYKRRILIFLQSSAVQ